MEAAPCQPQTVPLWSAYQRFPMQPERRPAHAPTRAPALLLAHAPTLALSTTPALLSFLMQCIEAAPEDVYGHVALCVSKGRLALFTDNKTKVGGAGCGRQRACSCCVPASAARLRLPPDACLPAPAPRLPLLQRLSVSVCAPRSDTSLRPGLCYLRVILNPVSV